MPRCAARAVLADITERPKITPRRIAYFGDNLPASTLVEMKGLADPRMKVEIECQAYVDQACCVTRPSWRVSGRCCASPGEP